MGKFKNEIQKNLTAPFSNLLFLQNKTNLPNHFLNNYNKNLI